jgi:hypothetical protein
MRWQEALKIKQKWTPEQARNDLERLIITGERPADKVVGLACQALDRQIPKKPVIKYHQEGKTPVKYGRLMELHCPNCNKLIAAMYETDRERGGGLHTDVKGCHKCLQAVDFAEYYYIGNLGEEIELE